MLNIYKSLGIEKIIEDKKLFKELNNIIDYNVTYIIPGYICDYYLCKFRGEIEFEQCRSLDGTVLGTDIHFSGTDHLFLTFDRAIDNDGRVHYYQMHHKLSTETFPVRIVCPDVLPNPKAGDELYGQVVAFSGGQVKYISDVDNGEGYVRDNGNGNVTIAGEISLVNEWEFEFCDVQADLYELEVETEIGRISVVMRKDNISNPTVGSFIRCEAVLSFDVSVRSKRLADAPFVKYKYPTVPFKMPYRTGCGFIPNYKNAMKVFSHCVENHTFQRFIRTCAEQVSFHDQVNCSSIEAKELVEIISTFVPPTCEKCQIAHILSSNYDELFGWDALVIGNDSEPIAAFTISVNRFGFVDEIWKLDPCTTIFGVDEELYAVAMLGYGMCDCKPEILREYLSEKCDYHSDYSNHMAIGAEQIIDWMSGVVDNIAETNQYTYQIIPANKVLHTQNDLPSIYNGRWCAVVYQGNKLAFNIFIQLNNTDKISKILLSRNGNYLKAFEFGENSEPIRKVTPMNVKELLKDFYGSKGTIAKMRDNEAPDENGNDVYIWRESDNFICSWLSRQNYYITNTELEDDCIGYACTRKGKDYAIYMYSYGQQQDVHIDAEYFQKLHTYTLSQGRMIIIVCLKVDVFTGKNGGIEYKVGNYQDPDKFPEMWKLHNVDGRNLLLLYQNQEIFDMAPRLMAAYNSKNMNWLKKIWNKDIKNLDAGDAFYSHMPYIYKKYGEMKIAYVRYNDFLYSRVLYLENYCYISFTVTDDTDRLCDIKANMLDGNYTELLVLEKDIEKARPHISKVLSLGSDWYSDFFAELVFDNGEIRRYDFEPEKWKIPFIKESKYHEVGIIGHTTFTDKIFAHGKLVDQIVDDGRDNGEYCQCGQGLSFANGYSISALELYFDGYTVGKFNHTDIDKEIELNEALFHASTSGVIDYDLIEEFLQQGAAPLGPINICGYYNNLYFEIISELFNNHKTPEDFYRITKLFLKYGMDISNPTIFYDDDDVLSPLWTFAFYSNDVVLRTLKLLLDNGLNDFDAGVCWGHALDDFCILGDELNDECDYEILYDFVRKIMLISSYPNILNNDEDLQNQIWLKENNYDVSKFRNWDEFIFDVDTSFCERYPKIYGSIVTIKEKQTGKIVWKFGIGLNPRHAKQYLKF